MTTTKSQSVNAVTRQGTDPEEARLVIFLKNLPGFEPNDAREGLTSHSLRRSRVTLE